MTGDWSEGLSVAARYPKWLEQLRNGEDPRIPTPWPDVTDLLRLKHRRKVGTVAQRGTREATLGRLVALHAARAGHQVALYTRYPPEVELETLTVVTADMVDAKRVNALADSSEQAGRPLELVVIERPERMHIDGMNEDSSRADQAEYAGQYLAVGCPVLFTTVVDQVPVLERPVLEWAGVDSPGGVMTDYCRSVLVLRRRDGEVVDVRVDLERDTYAFPEQRSVAWPR